MGSVICTKCFVPRDYYNKDPSNSCRVHDNEKYCYCGNKGNCFHRFEFVNYISQYYNKKYSLSNK